MTWQMVVWLIVSGIAVIVTVYDKVIAGGKRRRIPERTLFLIALLGGSAAMYLAMLVIRHKTKHKRFMLGLPLIIMVQLALWHLL